MILKVTIFDQIYVHEFNVILEKLEMAIAKHIYTQCQNQKPIFLSNSRWFWALQMGSLGE